nr:iron-sulfur cluster assembly scaffold protein [Porphyrobacter sp. GA68]
MRLVDYPWQEQHRFHATARSRTCGGTVALSLECADGRIAQLGLRVSACAVGQAAAAIFADGARGQTAGDVAIAAAALEAWLGGSGPAPGWPGLDALEPAMPHRGRHGAILLPWAAAVDALCNRRAPD